MDSLAAQIIALRKTLGLTQQQFGARVSASSMAVSRWERGDAEPSAAYLLKIGNLSEDTSVVWSFWNLAGLAIQDVVRVLPAAAKRMRRTLPVFQVVKAGPTKKGGSKPKDDDLVAIPFLKILAAAGNEKGSAENELRSAQSERYLAAPKLWCPHPEHTASMRVKGSSMEPTLLDGYMIVVDQKQTDRSKLQGQIVVVSHPKMGLVVSRYMRIHSSELLVSDNRSHEPVPLTSAWRLIGRVLWWIGEAEPSI